MAVEGRVASQNAERVHRDPRGVFALVGHRVRCAKAGAHVLRAQTRRDWFFWELREKVRDAVDQLMSDLAKIGGGELSGGLAHPLNMRKPGMPCDSRRFSFAKLLA